MPVDVQIPAEQHLRKKSSGDVSVNLPQSTPGISLTVMCVCTYNTQVDSSLYMVNTYCQQTSSEDFHSSGQRLAMEEMAKLYSHVQTMPDGHQKTQFLKKVRVDDVLSGVVLLFTSSDMIIVVVYL